MGFLTLVAGWSMLAFGAMLVACLGCVHEFGYWLGVRRARMAKRENDGVGVVVGGLLGLLAFVLALTLSFASSRFDERRQGALVEANAIGTAWLRAETIGEPRGTVIAKLLEDYTRLRIEFVRAPNTAAVLDDLNRRSNALQGEIWGHATAQARGKPDPVSTSLLAALNDAFDAATAMRYAYAAQVPSQIVWLLILMALVGMGAIGFQLGLRGTPLRIMAALLILTWSVLIVDILDLGAGRLGNLRTTTEAYEWTLQGFQGGVTIPPVPGVR